MPVWDLKSHLTEAVGLSYIGDACIQDAEEDAGHINSNLTNMAAYLAGVLAGIRGHGDKMTETYANCHRILAEGDEHLLRGAAMDSASPLLLNAAKDYRNALRNTSAPTTELTRLIGDVLAPQIEALLQTGNDIQAELAKMSNATTGASSSLDLSRQQIELYKQAL